MRRTCTALLAFLLTCTVATATATADMGSPEASSAGPPGSIEFVASNAIATANGVFRDWRIARASVDLATPSAGFLDVEIDVASLDTAIERRDDHLRTSDFFDVEKFPTATAHVHSAKAIESDDTGKKRFDVTIDLTIRGITHSVPARFTVVGEQPLRVEGGLTIDRTRWGIGEPDQRFNPMAVGNEIPIRFRATLGE